MKPIYIPNAGLLFSFLIGHDLDFTWRYIIALLTHL